MKYITGFCILWIFTVLFSTSVAQKAIYKNTFKSFRSGRISPDNKNFSPASRLFIHRLSEQGNSVARQYDSRFQRQFPISTIRNNRYIGALVKVNGNVDIEALGNLGIITGSRIGDILSMKIPLTALGQVRELPGIEYLEFDQHLVQELDSARSVTRAGMVQSGTGLPKTYTGKGVIIGIIDAGFDYTHPVFYDSAGTKLRISRVWNQTDDSGKTPDGFNYGTELSGQTDILDARFSTNDESHGTHVAGIAGASGLGTNGKYQGMAPDAEFVLVHYAGGISSIQDAIFYILNYAGSVQKPVVINMSLGSQIGPHDGTSSLDQVIDELSNDGIIVGSAGNSGDTGLHGTYQFDNDTTETVIYFEDTQDVYGQGLVNIWGSENSAFSVSVNAVNAAGEYIMISGFVSTTGNQSLDTVMVNGKDSLSVKIFGESKNINNNKPNIYLDIDNNTSDQVVTLKIAGESSVIHIWNHGQGQGARLSDDFPGFGVQSGWINGDNEYSMVEIGGTAGRIVTVGAYSAKTQYVNIKGTLKDIPFFTAYGDIAPFSSHGPTADGRLKPDITAPGNVVVSAVNSFDNRYTPGGRDYGDVAGSLTDGSKEWYFAAFQGTSMSAPVVTGIIALMLEAYPHLTPEQVKDLLGSSAIHDSLTGNIPTTGSNTWGKGKIDAQKAMQQLLSGLPEKPVISASGPLSFCDGDSLILMAPSASAYLWNTGESTREITVKDPGTYRVITLNDKGFLSDSSDSVEVDVHPLPEAAIILDGPGEFCEGDSVRLRGVFNEMFSYHWFLDGEPVSPPDNSFYVRNSATYRVEVLDTNGCTGISNDRIIVVDPTPEKPVLTPGFNRITTSVASGIQWYFNGQLQEGETGQTLKAGESGNYSLSYTDEHGCSVLSDTLNFTVVGLDDPPHAMAEIYPNPSNGKLILESVLSGPSHYTIIDLQGKIVCEKSMMLTGKDEINTGLTRKGYYIFYLESRGRRYLAKILIE